MTMGFSKIWFLEVNLGAEYLWVNRAKTWPLKDKAWHRDLLHRTTERLNLHINIACLEFWARLFCSPNPNPYFYRAINKASLRN